jgi:hypothetical protein
MAIRVIGIDLLVIGSTFCVRRLVGCAPNAYIAIGAGQIAIGTSLIAIGLNPMAKQREPKPPSP